MGYAFFIDWEFPMSRLSQRETHTDPDLRKSPLPRSEGDSSVQLNSLLSYFYV